MKALRLFLMVIIVLTIGLVSVGCTDSKDTSEITIWAWNKNVDVLADSVERYKEIKPDFKAKVVKFSSGDIDTKFKSASQQADGSHLADILLGDAINMRAYIAQWSSLFVDFSQYNVTTADQAKFVQSTIDIVTYGEKLYAMPYGIGPTVVFAYKPLWNADDLAAIKTNGWTWADYIAYGKKIKLAKGSDVYMSSYNMRTDDRLYRTMVSQKGEWFMDKDLNVQVGNVNSIAAMSMIKEMNDENLIKHFATGTYQVEMATGKIAAEIHGFATSGQIKSAAPNMSGDWEILPCPSWEEGGNRSSITGGSYLYVNNTLNKSKKERCVDFVKWYTLNTENSLKGLEIGGIYSPLLATYDTDYFKTTTESYFSEQKVYLDVANYTKNALSIYPSQYFTFNLSSYVAAQEQILFNNKSIPIALREANKAITSNKNK